MRAVSGAVMMIAALAGMSAADQPAAAVEPACEAPGLRLVVGQDLDAIRGYAGSGLFAEPHGVTTYLSLYNLLNPDADFGGLGMDATGEPLQVETDWGGGPINAWTAVAEFQPDALAIGLNFADYAGDGAIDRLVAGDYDAEIRQLGRFLDQVPMQIYLRIGYEFDGAWNPGYDDRKRFVAAYRHIADTLRTVDRPGLELVWQASTSPIDDVLDGQWEDPSDWYPGDDYVDWVGVSWFLSPLDRPLGADGPDGGMLVAELVSLARARGKPVMIAEAAPQGFDLSETYEAHISPVWDGAPGSQAQPRTTSEIWSRWYAPLFEFIDANSDTVRLLAYINVDWDSQDLWDAPYEGGFWGDSRLETSPDLAARWIDALAARAPVCTVHGE